MTTTEQAQPEAVASPTAGMNMAQRILHVGGRNNAAGYVEFGSVQAVEALVRQVIRDLPKQPQAEVVLDTPYPSSNVTTELVRFADIIRDCGRIVDKSGHIEQTLRNASAILAAPQQAEAVQPDELHTFLDAAAGEGLVLGGVDATDLYIMLFPERYAAAIADLKGQNK